MTGSFSDVYMDRWGYWNSYYYMSCCSLSAIIVMYVQLSNYVFTCGAFSLDIFDKYAYLGLVLTEHLDLNLTAKFVTKAAIGALGILIAKILGGMPHKVYKKLYDSMVRPVIAYGAAIMMGYHELFLYPSSWK